MEKLPSSKIILFFLFLGIFSGLILDKSYTILGLNFYNTFDLIGQIFINSLKMIVIPLIMSSLIYNISSFKTVNDISSLGIKTISFYLFTSFVAILTGIFIVNIIDPGLINGSGAANILGLKSSQNIDLIVESQNNYSLKSFLLNIFSGNIFISIANGNMLFIILFSVIFGLSIRSPSSKSISIVKDFWEGVYFRLYFCMYFY